MKFKQFLIQTLSIIGFAIAVAGVILSATESVAVEAIGSLAAALACAFVFSKNEIVKIVGYTLSVLVGAEGLQTVLLIMNGYVPDSYAIIAIGYIVMLVPAVIYALIKLFDYLGFVRAGSVKCNCDDIATLLTQYKAMEKEDVLSTEEFATLKEKVLENSNSKVTGLDDLKKWKKLLDQQVITEDEFANLKAKVFNN